MVALEISSRSEKSKISWWPACQVNWSRRCWSMGERWLRRGEKSEKGSHIRVEEEIKRIHRASWAFRTRSEAKEKASTIKNWEGSNEKEIRSNTKAWRAEIK